MGTGHTERFRKLPERLTPDDISPASSGRIIPRTSIWAVCFSFSGRINRKTYWLKGILLPISIFIGLLVASIVAGEFSKVAGYILSLPVLVVILAQIVIAIAVPVKRLHDRNKTGWWILTIYIPVIGLIFGLWFFVELGFLKGDPNPNRYGDVP